MHEETDQLARLKTALADRYRVERELGHGGMATVHLAHDLKHHRPVALKVLRQELAVALGSERFLREVRITARLNHPHILPLLDSGEAGGFVYYTMPYVEGESLRDRLTRERQLPLDDALQIAREVADALSYAHSHDVVHRDVKPENILLENGHAVVADFGIARAITAAGSERFTATGVVVGTAVYMSPEQASGGQDVDGRSDIYALGCVLYEMLAGHPPFLGSTVQELLARHSLDAVPSLRAARPSVPTPVDNAVQRALAKTPADRFRTASQFATALSPTRGLRHGAAYLAGRRLWIGATAALLVAAATFFVWRIYSSPVLVIGRSNKLTSAPGLEIQPAISPDSKLVAYAAGNSARMRIFLRPVGGGRTIPLSDDSTAVETQPRWSPDGTQLLFLSRGGVSVSPALGGVSHPIIPPAPTPRATVVSATWSPDGREVAFVRADSLLVSPVGGGHTRLVAISRDTHSCAWSPDGKWIACVVLNWESVRPGVDFGNLAPSAIDLFPAAGGAPQRVVEPATFNQSPVWAPWRNGRLFFISSRDGPRDVYALDLSASGKPRHPPFRLSTGLGALSISLSADGSTLAYAVYTERANIWSLPIPRHPPVTIDHATPITTGSQVIESMRVSRDGRWLLYDSNLRGNSDIYRLPLRGGEPEQLTDNPADEFAPDLSPDGTLLAYHSWRTGTRDIELMPLDGSPVQHLTETSGQESYPYWSPEGGSIEFRDQVPPQTLYLVRRAPDGSWSTPTRLAVSAVGSAWSPDGHWIAYIDIATGPHFRGISMVGQDGESRRALFDPAPNAPQADWIEWSPDGLSIYYKAHDSQGRASIWAVNVSGGLPRLLVRFPDPDRQSNRPDFTSDGKRFYFGIEDRQSDVWVASMALR